MILHFLPWCCTFYLDVVLSTLMAFSTVTLITFSTLILHFLLSCCVTWWRFLPWCSTFYLDVAFFYLNGIFWCHLIKKKCFLSIEKFTNCVVPVFLSPVALEGSPRFLAIFETSPSEGGIQPERFKQGHLMVLLKSQTYWIKCWRQKDVIKILILTIDRRLKL